MTETQRIAFLDALFAKNKAAYGDLVMMAQPAEDDDNDLDDLTDDDSNEDDDDSDNQDDDDSDEDEDDGTEDELIEALAEELAAEDGEDEDVAGPKATQTIKTLRQYLKDHGIDPKTGKKKIKAEDIAGATPKGDAQVRQARVALKDLAADYGFDPEYNDVLTKLAGKVKFDEDGDLVKSSVKAIVADLRERKAAFFTSDDSDESPTVTRKLPGKPKEKRGGPRNTRVAATTASNIRSIEAKINAKQQLTVPEISKLAADESTRGKALYSRASENKLLSALGY